MPGKTDRNVDNGIQGEMDAAAERAKKDLQPNWSAKQLAGWIKKWYITAGYKRLNRILMAYYKV